MLCRCVFIDALLSMAHLSGHRLLYIKGALCMPTPSGMFGRRVAIATCNRRNVNIRNTSLHVQGLNDERAYIQAILCA